MSRRTPSAHARHRHPVRTVLRETIVASVAIVVAGGALAFDAVAEDQPEVQTAAASGIAPAADARIFAGAIDGVSVDPARMVAAREEAARSAQEQLAAEVAAARAAADQAAADQAAADRAAVWDRLADCESGAWDREGHPVPGTARWSYGLAEGEDGFFQGGLQFHPETWDAFRDPGMPDHAGNASREQQIAIAERVLEAQGWVAWPVCSRKLGYR